MELALKAKKRNFALALILTLGLIAGIPCIVLGAINMGDNKGFVALLVFGIVGTVLLSVNGKTASATLNNCIRKGYLVGYIREGDRLVLNENRALGPTQYTLVCSHCGATVELTKGDTARCPYCGSVLSDPGKH